MTTEQAIQYALSEEECASPAISPPEEWPSAKPPGKLTRREEEIAILMTQGLTNRRIADKLTLSERTVDTHVSRILRRLGVQSRQQVADLLAKE